MQQENPKYQIGFYIRGPATGQSMYQPDSEEIQWTNNFFTEVTPEDIDQAAALFGSVVIRQL